MDYWQWWATGGVLMVIEVFAPGFVFMWLGLSAILTGFLVLALPALGWQWQFLFFACLAVASAAGWLVYRRRHPPPPTDEPDLNRRAARYVGHTATLVTPIENGAGRAKLGDTTWAVLGPDLPAGARVRITGTHGTRLEVRPADPP